MRSHIETLFYAVADLSTEARARYYSDHNIDAPTQSEVEALVAFDTHSTTTLKRDLGEVAEHALERVEPQGMLCGPYHLGDLLGRGGMGTVYRAERVDGEVTQKVAIKLLRPGVDDPLVRQRFLSERQILATLSHPNIARLLDAGHREDGQPYLVMEYVEGKPIDEYAAGLGIRQKIGLFIRVAAAVSHLHRNLVVHRDLKPANILVNEEGEPKLLDFGIAKMLDLTTDTTVTGMRMLTPDYASPEQVAGGAVTTATDVYSLGAVLYKMLTGASPHQFDGDSPGSIAAAISSGKITQPSKLAPELECDLEAVLLKALRKEPEARYTTVEQFAEDLENYLELRPIRARKGDTWYRTGKFVRRYWLPVAAATLAAAGLFGGILVANRQRAIAQRRFVQVRQLAGKLFDIEAEVRQASGTTKARELIVATALDYLKGLAAEVHGDPDLAMELGEAYLRVARVQGTNTGFNLGHFEQADQSLQVAEKLIAAVLVDQPRNRKAVFRSAEISHDRMILAQLQRKGTEETLRLAAKTEGSLTRYESFGKILPEDADRLTAIYMNIGTRYAFLDHLDEAIRLASRARDIAQQAGLNNRVGAAMWSLANSYERKGEIDQAVRSIAEAVRLLEPPPGMNKSVRVMTFASSLVTQSEILADLNDFAGGRPEEALPPVERGYKLLDDLAQRDFNDNESRNRLFSAAIQLAGLLVNRDPRRALSIYDHTLSRLAELPKNAGARRKEAWTLGLSTLALRRLGRNAEARRRLDTAMAQLKELKLYPGSQTTPEVHDTLCALGDYEAATGNRRHALEVFGELLRMTLATVPGPDFPLETTGHLSRIYAAIADIHRHAGRNDLAAQLDERRQGLWQRWDVKRPGNRYIQRQLQAVTGSVP